MKTLCRLLLLPLLATAAHAQAGKQVGAYSRIFQHLDGTRTESFKHGDKNTIEELTYKNNILHCKRVFMTDSKGRNRQGVIYDAKLNPLGTIQFGYDPTTDQLVEERQFNKNGKLIRRLFYPGSLKEPEFAKRFVAFTYDPDNPNAQGVLVRAPVKPTRPVESNQDEFEPGIPINPSSSGARPATEASAAAAPGKSAKPAKRGFSFLVPRKP